MRYLLCTDLDRTLIANGHQPASPLAHERFRRLSDRDEICLVYVTGRDRSLVEQAMAEFDLPQQDMIIADVGSSIYQVGTTGWHALDEWRSRIGADWKGATHGDLQRLLSVYPMLRLQEPGKQGEYKLSYYVPFDSDIPPLLEAIRLRLQGAGISANLIWSVDEIAQVGLLDVLPASASKLHAIRFLMRHLRFGEQNTVFAGDSGNDLDVLLSDIPSILVANADAEVKMSVKDADPERLYVAQGAFLGMNGNYSAGILEGVAHYWPDAGRWLREMD